jgi:hypothetical protein
MAYKITTTISRITLDGIETLSRESITKRTELQAWQEWTDAPGEWLGRGFTVDQHTRHHLVMSKDDLIVVFDRDVDAPNPLSVELGYHI